MKFETPAGLNPIDKGVHIGRPHPRIEGPLKTTGQATYAYEQWDLPAKPAYGWVLGAGIAKGRLVSLDIADAQDATGVLAVVTADNASVPGKGGRNVAKLFASSRIEHYHQAIAIVVAETFEQARFAASLIKPNYARDEGQFDLAAVKATATKPKAGGPLGEPDSSYGDFETAFAAAPIQLDETYTTPGETHAMMEPHASIAAWDDDGKLTVWTSNQMIAWARQDLGKTFDLPKEKIRVISPYIGGGFGGKLFLRSDVVCAALASQAVGGRPVKLALQRPLIANNTTHRPATIQRLRIGADESGRILAIGHENWCGNLESGAADSSVSQTRELYAGDNRMTRTRLATLDLPESNAMRAPGEATGLMTLEIAMDELAERLGIDPVALRIINDTQVNPEKREQPYSMRNLTQCLRDGADRFRWSERPAKPASRREGDWLVGYGMATAFRNNQNGKSAARVRLGADGKLTVETDMTDIGTGSYTIIAQTAAEMLGLPLEAIDVRLGDSDFPVSAGSGGQWGANSSTSGVYAACVKLREAIAHKLGVDGETADFVDGEVRSGNRSYALADATREGELVAEDRIEWGDIENDFKQSTFGAHFVEVGVDVYTGEVRVRRMLAVCASGRILNPQTARSQVIGAMTMGVGAALMEELAVDTRYGLFVNHDLAGYEVPVHADIPHQEVVFLDEVDDKVSPMKAKGVAELGICGVAAALANAIYNATGVRVRDYPITLDKHLEHLPEVA
jgi:xanthine dehydrogenase YagR molybdenum-binding subunit